jgi:hypothetical protein
MRSWAGRRIAVSTRFRQSFQPLNCRKITDMQKPLKGVSHSRSLPHFAHLFLP